VRLVTFRAAGSERRLGAVLDDRVIDITDAVEKAARKPASMTTLIATGELCLREIRSAVANSSGGVPLAETCLEAPVTRPGKIIGVGLNYTAHVDESSRSLDTSAALPERPVLFSKPATAVIGPGGVIRHDHRLTRELDWEVELAVVIGRRIREVDADGALEHVFGYTVMNDISARDQRRSGQWFFSKGQDSYAPMGPLIITADEIPDPHALGLRLRVNGAVKQESNTAQMLFRISELIADISSGMTLEPGDIISTGSPAGVGASRNPPEFLRPGDVVEAEIDGIGTLRNEVVDATR
jgi:2-keto-4-pentenoate hydratase/2-oxohepta-3-ene-1,7-dioic acid hydratase in catechol pathway